MYIVTDWHLIRAGIGRERDGRKNRRREGLHLQTRITQRLSSTAGMLVPTQRLGRANHTQPDHDFDPRGGFICRQVGVDIGPDIVGDICDRLRLSETRSIDAQTT